jgi:hypothetical protein
LNGTRREETEATMAKKSIKRTTKPPTPAAPAKEPVATKPAGSPTASAPVAAPKPPPAPVVGQPAPKTPPLCAAPPPAPPLATPPPKAAAHQNAPAPVALKPVATAFVLDAPDAKRVQLCGDFNGWKPESTPMARKTGGRWEATVPLPPGRYQYKFVADGHWLHDPKALENVPNEHGSLNSVIQVRA